jgi:hypothetical protein
LLKNRLLEQNQQKISNDLRLQQTNLTKQINDFYKDVEASGRKITDEEKDQLKQLIGQRDAIGKLVFSLDSANEAQAGITKELEDQLTSILAIEAKTGIAGKLLKGFSKIPIIGDMLDIQGAQKAMNVAAASGANGFKTMLTGVKALGPSLKAALGPLGLILAAVDAFKALVDVMFAADKQVTSIARNLSVSKEVAADIRSSFNAIATASGLQYNRLEDIIEAQIQLSELSKFTILYSAEALTNQVLLTKEIGLAASEATALNKTFILNNKEGKAGTLVVEKQILSLAKQTGLLANGRKILQEVSKASGQILLNFRGNLPALADAVLQAEMLGINLSEARDISNSLLDFESSINNELEASVFLGRRFNLEQARTLALRKDYVGATQEVLKQVGSIEEFESMSAIHQQVIAKAAGMTVDKLSDSLMYQKFLGIESEKNLKRLLDAGQKDLVLRAARGELAEGELIKNLSALDAQEKFNIALDKAKEIFTSLITGGTLDILADSLKNIANYVASITGTKGRLNITTGQSIAESSKQELEKVKSSNSIEDKKLIRASLLSEKQDLEDIIKGQVNISDIFYDIQQIPKALSLMFGSIEDKAKVMTEVGILSAAAQDAKNTLQPIDEAINKLTKEIQTLQPAQPKQKIQDGASIDNDGPFEITNRYGQTAVTAVGDKIAVSPNVSVNKTTQPTFNLTPMINAINEVRNAVATLTNKPTPQPTFVFQGNGAELGRFIGQYSELGTAQNINTAYLSS